jgi:hypothetical protein
MAFQISPGVNVTEVDLTTVVPSVLTTAGAFAGTFNWGPVEQITLIDNEVTLVSKFGKPDSNSAISFFTAASFLAYGNNLNVVRAVGSTAKNADSSSSGQTLVKNSSVFENTLLNIDNNNTNGSFMARYPGAMGNSLRVSVCDNDADFGTWAYKGYFTTSPGTSNFAAAVNGSTDEMHIVVIDYDGKFTGTKNTVLETYAFVSKASNASINGVSNYYKQVIFNQSKYVYAVDPVSYGTTAATWNKPADGRTFAVLNGTVTVDLQNGTDVATTTGALTTAYDLFTNKETLDISLVITGDAPYAVQQNIIDSLANVSPSYNSRRDCVVFISPPSASVVNNIGSENTSITTWLSNLARSNSYVVADSGWKYQYDKYNNVYRWVPLNGDIAGLCVYTDTARDPWFSPAGFSRGAIKNAIKLAWNPNKTQRDVLYAAGVNPVVSFPGQGIVLFGDKTLQSKPSAFDRINVRRLFITLEKAIATAAKFSLFELNDEFTRSQFVALITPFLRDVQGRRGITDFKVICDGTNNTGQVIDSNQFVGDIYIKPARSINYIQLNFVAVGSGVDFTTIVGAV